MDFKNEQHGKWSLIELPERVDAFNFSEAQSQLQTGTQRSQNLCLNLKTARFLSLPSIKYIHSVALEVVKKGGLFALVSPTEKIKRQFDIFASLGPIQVFPTLEDWQVNYGFIKQAKKKQIRIEDNQASSPL